MFEVVRTHKKFTNTFGVELIPVATLENFTTNRLCHIVVEDDSYIAYLYEVDFGYTPTYYIFPELLEVLCALPALGTPIIDEV